MTYHALTELMARAAQCLKQRADYREATASLEEATPINLEEVRADRKAAEQLAVLAAHPDRYFLRSPEPSNQKVKP